MAFSSVLQMYLGWANSLLCEQGILIDGLHQLRDGTVFCQLIELLTGTQLIPKDQDDLAEESLALDTVQIALDYLAAVGVKISIHAEGIVHGELKSILDVLWSIILHCTIHSPDRAAYQRTVRIGRKLLLQWCGEQLDVHIDSNKSLALVFSGNNRLSDLLSLHCSFENDRHNPGKHLVNLTNGILAAEDHFAISKTLLGPAEIINGTSDEHSLMIYLALLRRKVKMLSSRHCSVSSDEDEFIKISPTRQSPNCSILSTSRSQLSTPNPPHHRYAPDFPSATYKSPAVDVSPPNRAVVTSRDITPEKSDSGISVSADAPSSSSSSLPSAPSSRTREPKDSGSFLQTTHGTVYASLPSKTTRRNEVSQNETSGHHSVGRSRTVDTVSRGGSGVNSERDLRNPVEVPSSSVDNYSRCDEGSTQAEGPPLHGEATGSQPEEDATNEKGEDCVEKSKDQRTKEAELARSPDDELLHLLDAIGQESKHLVLELNETQQREAILKTQLEVEVIGSTKEEQVISKLVQELEMLRTENRRLFREAANAKNANALDRKTVEKLNATIAKLQMEIEHQSAENFSLKMKSKTGAEAVSEAPPDQACAGRELGELKRDLARTEAQKEFLRTRLTEMEEATKGRLSEASEDLRKSKLESLRLEKECKLLRMSSETSRLEVETVTGRCRRLEEYLSYAQKRNARLAQQFEDECLQGSPQGKHGQSRAPLAKLEEENALLKQKVELSEEERTLLKQELSHYRQNKTTLDEVLRAWDVQTSSKFQSFLDDFRLHINERREPQATKSTRDAKADDRLKVVETRTASTENLDRNDITTSTRSLSSNNSEKSSRSLGRWERSEEPSREPLPGVQLERKPLTSENLASLGATSSVIDEKYLQVSPRQMDTDTEADSEMDFQSTEGAVCDQPGGSREQADRGNQVPATGVPTRRRLSDGFRRPSLGDLIVAKAQNSPPEGKEVHRHDSDEKSSRKGSMEADRKSRESNHDAAVVQGDNAEAPSAADDPSRDPPPQSQLHGRMRFSAVHSSLESLREITKKAKLKPDRSAPGAAEGHRERPRDADKPADAPGKEDETLDAKAGGDNQVSLGRGDVQVTNGHDLDSVSLPESSTFQMHQRVAPSQGRLPRWRRMQNRSQAALDGSYLDGCKAATNPAQHSSSEQRQDWRNRSSSLSSPLNSHQNVQGAAGKHCGLLNGSEPGLASLDSDEEYASLPERRSIPQGSAIEQRGPLKDPQANQLPRDEADGNAESSVMKDGYAGREVTRRCPDASGDGLSSRDRVGPLGSASQPHFSSPQRLGFLRSKLGMKLERELLQSSNTSKETLHEGASPALPKTSIPRPGQRLTNGSHSSEVQSANQNHSSQVQSANQNHSSEVQSANQNHSSQVQSANQNHSSEVQSANQSESLKSGHSLSTDPVAKGNTNGSQTPPASKQGSPDVSKMSPASYSQYYKHKMMNETDQEYANSIIEKYLKQI